MDEQILIQNDAHTLQLKAGNIICGNVIKGTSTPSQIFIDPNAAGFTFSSNCAGPPIVSAGSNQTIALPINQASLSGSATANQGTIVTYSWIKQSGPATFTITTPLSQNTSVTGLIQGVYVFQLTATDSNGLSNSSTVTVTVTAPIVPSSSGRVPLSLKRKIIQKS